ncbi:MAG: hypothetical protein KAT17_07025 [Candidatus Aminicenantes bacterium]|nr:hypothetical protein [Candidatus Aminicenantes bacterium]
MPRLMKIGSIVLEVKAAKDCIRKGMIDPAELGLLINTGIYRDEHIGEPAIAAFLQRRIGANPLFNENGTTFAFDLNNGGAGVVTALGVLSGFINTETAEKGIIISGDANPTPGFTVGFEFMPSAGAIILEKGPEGQGFIAFDEFTYPEYKDSFSSIVEWTNLGAGGKKRHILQIKKKRTYLKECLECSQDGLKKFLKNNHLKLDDIDLFITSQSPTTFPSKLSENLNINDRLIDVTPKTGNLHTSGPIAALDQAFWSNDFKEMKNILILAVGSGITVGCALYRNP